MEILQHNQLHPYPFVCSVCCIVSSIVVCNEGLVFAMKTCKFIATDMNSR